VLATKAERRSQAQRRDEAEQRLLEAAIRLVGSEAWSGLRWRRSARRRGYSRGLPAHYFGGKDGLIVALAST